MSTKQKIANLILFQLFWFVSVLSGANDLWGLSFAGIAILLFFHFVIVSQNKTLDLKLLGFALLWGIFADSLLSALGYLDFSTDFGGPLHWLSPPWMFFLWVGFATTLTGCLDWMRDKFALQVFFGAIGGPGAYFAGSKLGALELGEPLGWSLTAIAFIYAVSMPLLYSALKRLEPAK